MLSKIKNFIVQVFILSLFYSRILVIINFVINNIKLNKNTKKNIDFPYIKRRDSKNFQILTYHRINNDNDQFFTGMRVDIFEKHIEYLSNYYNILSLEDMINCMKSNDIKDNAIVITFDDGYKDVYLNAYPILRRYSVPATIFLPTSCIDTGDI